MSLPTGTQYADNDGVTIAWGARGPDSGRPILLVHGLGYARWGWEPVIDRLAVAHRVVAFDNRGIDDSDVPEGPYTAQTMATDAIAVLDAAGIQRAHVIGASLGGMIAQELALGWPERVDHLVLAATTPGGDLAHPIPAATLDLISNMPRMQPADAMRAAVDNALGTVAGAAREHLVERIMAHRLASPQDPAGWQAQAHAGTTHDAGDRVGDIAHPTLVAHGTADAVVDPRNADVLARLIDDVVVHLFPGAGHLFFWEHPNEFVTTVQTFLA